MCGVQSISLSIQDAYLIRVALGCGQRTLGNCLPNSGRLLGSPVKFSEECMVRPAPCSGVRVPVQPLTRSQAAAARRLMEDLALTLFGIHSSSLHSGLIEDSLRRRIDCRLEIEDAAVRGLVLTAPASYWYRAPLRHPLIGLDCIRARIRQKEPAHPTTAGTRAEMGGEFDPESPNRTWDNPGDAWRVIFVGTARAARGQGVGARLYESVMADRPLVARIAADNVASLRLHRSLGWRLYRDGSVVLAVHDDPSTLLRSARRAADGRRGDVPRDAGSYSTASELHLGSS